MNIMKNSIDMIKKYLRVILPLFMLASGVPSFSQVGINTFLPDSSSMLDIRATDRGLLIPRLTPGQRRSLMDRFQDPANSLTVFDTRHRLFYFLDANETSAADLKGTWKALNPWTLRGSYLNTNSNAVFFMGNVGIGTEDPVSELEINGTTTSVNVTATDRVTTGLVRARTNDGLYLSDNNDRGIFVEDGGRVGINVDDPNDRLDVGGVIDATDGYKLGDRMLLSANEEDNFFLGWNIHKALSTTVSRNILIGTDAGVSMTEGYGNVLIGNEAGKNSIDKMHGNVMIGPSAGANTVSTGGYVMGNVYIGTQAGEDCAGTWNVFIGDGAGRDKTTGWNNIFMGQFAGTGAGTGDDNILIGEQSGQMMGDGSENIFIGSAAGMMADGSGNICIGLRAGFLAGNNSIIIGNEVDAGDNELVIHNGSVTATPLIKGNFADATLTINGDLTVTGACTGCSSDSTLKTNIKPLGSSLSKLMQLKGYTYSWKETTTHYQNQQGPQIGLMAQEVQEVFPLIVGTSKEGYLYIDYQKMVVPLVESVKELKTQLDHKDQEIQDLKERLARIENLLLQNESSTAQIKK